MVSEVVYNKSIEDLIKNGEKLLWLSSADSRSLIKRLRTSKSLILKAGVFISYIMSKIKGPVGITFALTNEHGANC